MHCGKKWWIREFVAPIYISFKSWLCCCSLPAVAPQQLEGLRMDKPLAVYLPKRQSLGSTSVRCRNIELLVVKKPFVCLVSLLINFGIFFFFSTANNLLLIDGNFSIYEPRYREKLLQRYLKKAKVLSQCHHLIEKLTLRNITRFWMVWILKFISEYFRSHSRLKWSYRHRFFICLLTKPALERAV